MRSFIDAINASNHYFKSTQTLKTLQQPCKQARKYEYFNIAFSIEDIICHQDDN